MLGTFVLTMRNKNDDHQARDVQVEGEECSWDQFAQRTSCNCNEVCKHSSSGTPKDSVWLYVGISVLYFLLIGVVLLILLLGPQWRPMKSFEFHASSLPPGELINVEQTHNHEASQSQPSDASSSDYISTFDESKETFQGSPKDPLYHDIDPRSSIDNHNHAWMETSGKVDMGKEKHVRIGKQEAI